jgi:hypothetical protein
MSAASNTPSFPFRLEGSQTIPFQVPLCEDPRTMSRKTLISKLKSRKLTITGTKKVLSARLLKVVVEEALKEKFDPHGMDDRQPEKWSHIANLAHREGQEIEPIPLRRGECMQRSNEWINKQLMDRQRLTEVARGALYSDDASDTFRAALRLGASLTIQPLVEQDAARTTGVSTEIFRRSGFIFQLFSGFASIPEHLTEEYALMNDIREKSEANNRREKKRFRIENEGKRANTITVELNEEILVKMGNGRSVKARVTKVEAAAEGDTTILPGKPLLNLEVDN